MQKILRNISIFSIISLFMMGCDDTYISSVPEYPVYLQLNLVTTYPIFRNSTNKYLIFLKPLTVEDRIGYGGVLVYTDYIGEYCAFDLSCPYEHKQNTKVHPNDIGQAICDSCGTVYDILNGVGNPASGKAKEVLKRYKTFLSGDVLYITNK